MQIDKHQVLIAVKKCRGKLISLKYDKQISNQTSERVTLRKPKFQNFVIPLSILK